MSYLNCDREKLYSMVNNTIRQILGIFDPNILKEDQLEEGLKRGENVFYQDDVIRSDERGFYAGNEERLRLYQEHMAKLISGDPSVRVIGNIAAAKDDLE